MQEKSIATLGSIFREGPKPVLLLGAGASIKSGIPSTVEFVDQASKWAYAKEHGLTIDDVRIRRSDWLPWVTQKGWFQEGKNPSDLYPEVVENLLQPRQMRKDFFLRILNPNVPASVGYEKLAEFVANRVFETILTTNFDGLVFDACKATPKVHHLEVIKNPDDYAKFSTSPEYPQLIHLHGDVENYTDKNLLEEVDRMNEGLVECIVPLLRDHPLIVVGYRGAEGSVMKHLLSDNVDKAGKYRRGIYWCLLEGEEVHPNVKDLWSLVGHNLQLVRITGFDELMTSPVLEPYVKGKFSRERVSSYSLSTNVINDFKIIDRAGLSDLDEVFLRSRLIRYCESLRLELPEKPSRDWLNRFQEEKDLIKHQQDVWYPTFAGLMLFGKEPQVIFSNLVINVRIEDDKNWLNNIFKSQGSEDEEEFVLNRKVEGNLWQQLDELTELFSLFNKPFRLKAEVSETVLSYPPIALKELLVNALVHRDYEVGDPIEVCICPTYIEINNPGGLVFDVKSIIGDKSIEENIKRGVRGVKGYRNPVLADFFYGAGAMDKAGSGLADVVQVVEKNGGMVTFGPDENNRCFSARLYSRPEAVDQSTQTSAPKTEIRTTFVSNVLEFVELPEYVFIGTATYSRLSDIWNMYPGSWLPPFQQISKNRIISFFDITSQETVLSEFIDKGTVDKIPLEEFLIDKYYEREFVKLMNRCLYQHFYAVGLVVDRIKKRAYFPKESDESNRTITYQARVKSATRTVAKRITKRNAEETLYWEHRSFSFHVEKYGESWGLVILPSYVFTVDGFKWLVASDKISKLATKRSSRDYNMSVLNDVNFWSWVIASGKKNYFFLETTKTGEDPFYEDEIVGLSCVTPKARIVQVGQEDTLGEVDEFIAEDEIEDEIAELAKEELKQKSSNP